IQLNPQLGGMLRILIVLRQLFANFTRRSAYHRVSIGIVIGCAAEHVDSERTLLQLVRVSSQGTRGDMPQQSPAAMAAAEKRTVQDALYLRPDPFLLQRLQLWGR